MTTNIFSKMKLHDVLTKLIDKRPIIYVTLTLPESVINSKKFHKVTMSQDALQWHFTHGIIRDEYFFSGIIKVDAE